MPVLSHTFLQNDHEIISMVILLLTLIQELQAKVYCLQKVGDIGTYKSLKIKILICRINNFVFS